MEKEKSKNIIIVILSIVVLLLVVVLTLVFSGVINFMKTEPEPIPSGNPVPEVTITETEALEKVKNVVTNKTWMSFNCDAYINEGKTGKDSVNYVSSEDLGFNYEYDYYQCKFNSYDELINYYRKTLTQNYIDSYVKQNSLLLAKEYTGTDGTKYYNFVEKNGKMYCRSQSNGSDNNHEKYLEKSTYNVTEYNNNIIKADVKAYWLNISDDEYIDNVKVVLRNENNIWKLDEFNIADKN